MAAKLSARVSGTTGTKCCCDPPIITECRKRAGTATLVGYSELATFVTTESGDVVVDFKSTPPRKYLRRTFSGSTESHVHRPNWPGRLYNYIHELSGSDQYNPATGSWVTAGVCKHTYYVNQDPPTVSYNYSQANLQTSPIEPRGALRNWIMYDYPYQWATYTANATTATASLVCSDVSASGTITMTMDMEDTEDAAEVRSTATWGEWYLRGGTGCGTNDCCTAKRQLRTTGFSFTFQEAEFRLGIEEGTVGTAYTVAVDIIRKLTAGSEWSLVDTQYFSVTATAPGASHDGWGTYSVTQQRGYDVTVDNIRIYRAP